jgi:hypothetical protein
VRVFGSRCGSSYGIRNKEKGTRNKEKGTGRGKEEKGVRAENTVDDHKLAYDRYINSTAWERRRAAFFATHPKVCRACGATEGIHLHHHTYRRLGQEPDRDLVPLCPHCHSLVHELHDETPWISLTHATRRFLHMHGAELNHERAAPENRRRIQ